MEFRLVAENMLKILCLIELNLFSRLSFISPPSVNDGYCDSVLLVNQLINVSVQLICVGMGR